MVISATIRDVRASNHLGVCCTRSTCIPVSTRGVCPWATTPNCKPVRKRRVRPDRPAQRWRRADEGLSAAQGTINSGGLTKLSDRRLEELNRQAWAKKEHTRHTLAK